MRGANSPISNFSFVVLFLVATACFVGNAEAENLPQSISVIDKELLHKAFNGSESVFFGKIVRLGEPPPFLTSKGFAYQFVTYEVLKVFRGNGLRVGDRVDVDYLLIEGAPGRLVMNNKLIALDPQIFITQTNAIVLAQTYYLTADRQRWRETDVQVGTFSATPSNVELVESLIVGGK